MRTLIYLLQVSACISIFYLFYFVLLRRLTFFTLNRWYLLATLVLSFIIPIISITINKQYAPVVQQVLYINQLQILPIQPQPSNSHQLIVQPAINGLSLLKLIYLIGVAVLFTRLMVTFIAFMINVRKSKTTHVGWIKIITSDKELNNGSFFHFIFLNNDRLEAGEAKQIIKHEMLHVKLFHSADRLAVKLMQIVLWFNPFIYLYAYAVEQNHEFEVDFEVALIADKRKYADMLLRLAISRQGMLYNSFSKTPLKNRITMLFTKPTSHMKKTIYMLSLPILTVSCLAFAKVKNETAKTFSAEKVGVKNPVYTATPLKIMQSSVLSKPPAINKPAAVNVKTAITIVKADTTSDFYTRIHVQNKDGKDFDKITFKLSGEVASANLGAGDEIGTFIDGVFYNEDAIKKISAQKASTLVFDRNVSMPGKIPEGNYAVPFVFKTKKVTPEIIPTGQN
jgi:hypothetical protein